MKELITIQPNNPNLVISEDSITFCGQTAKIEDTLQSGTYYNTGDSNLDNKLESLYDAHNNNIDIDDIAKIGGCQYVFTYNNSTYYF